MQVATRIGAAEKNSGLLTARERMERALRSLLNLAGIDIVTSYMRLGLVVPQELEHAQSYYERNTRPFDSPEGPPDPLLAVPLVTLTRCGVPTTWRCLPPEFATCRKMSSSRSCKTVGSMRIRRSPSWHRSMSCSRARDSLRTEAAQPNRAGVGDDSNALVEAVYVSPA